MKTYIILTLLLFSSAVVFPQQTKRDSILRNVEEYKGRVFKDATVFINNSNPAEQRIKAIQKHAIIYDEQQKMLFKRIVLSENENPVIRALALNKIYNEADKDAEFFNQIVNWFSNSRTPKPLRDETLGLIGNLSFSSMPGILDAYHKMVEDPDLVYREFAFNKLVLNGDTKAQQLLIRGLEDSNARPLDVLTSIRILSSAPKKDFYPVVYKIMQETKNEEERLLAIQTLGGYPTAKDKLKSIFLSREEKSKFRESALIAFYNYNKRETVNYLTEILNDPSASSDLKIIAVQLAINERKAITYRKKAKRADTLDNLIREIANSKNDSERELVAISKKYLLLVRPTF
ncbi:hypothetical protein [Flavobacterium sp.]|uniref:hypothetical protein n=1 Tax=Flavobacterium sp. TaxID=239 RepID=UPI003D6BBCA2